MRRRDNNLQWTLCCRSITAIDGIYPPGERGAGRRGRGEGGGRRGGYRGKDERHIDSADIQVSIGGGNLLKVLSEFHNAVKVCRSNGAAFGPRETSFLGNMPFSARGRARVCYK